ncbi:class I adenylate-forming enzyme family protein [Chengkuizengella axinellae]|uniref:Class I adenylate-forming enzyme family protein n=1 Tax=Chengkuizengella axinellae TaxID=3064388 RepID=A0ABT9IZ52_9BACL|nr:class I adenylate-forming enzyme family protein [Chengkuizengella sp. 2205SS18-9]MDP5274595.1 class I adenylate-forming enzyme family protein [Chengkuizengella sp. 2205SS18-9]
MSLWNELERSFHNHSHQKAALSPNGRWVTYGELMNTVNEKVKILREIIPSGSKVAVIDTHPFLEMVHIVSLIRLNVTIIPLATKYGEDRCNQIITHIKPDFIVSSAEQHIPSKVFVQCIEMGTRVTTDENTILDLEIQLDEESKRNGETLPSSFIMYTSGSTGDPKGAIITYQNILSNIQDIISYFKVTAQDHILINRSLSHASVLTGELLYGLISGARISYYTETFIPRRLLRFIEEKEITVFCSTPTVFNQIALDKSKYQCPSLKRVALMGEYLHKQVALQVRKRFPHVEFYMNYGQTEASPRITYLPSRYFTAKESCIGIPLPSIEIDIVDEFGASVDLGAKGELIVKGPNVFKGYWNLPKLTVHKLKNGWLYTGDIVSLGEDGYIYIFGRRDDMIIRAGMNIYPKEIEDVLLEDHRVREVVVFGTKEPKYGQKINVHVIPDEAVELTVSNIMGICRKELASYQYPDEIEIVNEIPKNLAGKIMRKQVVYHN